MKERTFGETAFGQFLWMVFKLALFLIAIVAVFVIGLIIGYAFIGGGNYWEVLNRDTWEHIINFIR